MIQKVDSRERHAVIIPLRSFKTGKSRLVLSSMNDRKELISTIARYVIQATEAYPTFIMTRDPEVAAWAIQNNVGVIDERGSDLNDSLTDCSKLLENQGYKRLAIVLGDLPLISKCDIDDALLSDIVHIISDDRSSGTNVLAFGLPTPIKFAFGANSFLRHTSQLRDMELEFRVADKSVAGIDLDCNDDLDKLSELSKSEQTLSADAHKRILHIASIVKSSITDILPQIAERTNS